jgi:hypothetical protein
MTTEAERVTNVELNAQRLPLTLQEQIMDAPEEKLREWMRTIGPASPKWSGIVAELQWRTANKLNAAVEGLAKSSAVLERYTVTLVRLQWAVIGLTVAILALTVCSIVFR